MTTKTETEQIKVFYNEKSHELRLLLITEDDKVTMMRFKKEFTQHGKGSKSWLEYCQRWKLTKIAEGSRQVQYKIVEKKIRV